MSRLKLDTNFNDAIFAMSEGNPGAVTVLMDALRKGDEIDPEGMGAWGFLLNLDYLGIYGSRIWVLYKDVCGENLAKSIAMVRSVQMGILPKADLDGAINGLGSLDPDKVTERLREKLPSFVI